MPDLNDAVASNPATSTPTTPSSSPSVSASQTSTPSPASQSATSIPSGAAGGAQPVSSGTDPIGTAAAAGSGATQTATPSAPSWLTKVRSAGIGNLPDDEDAAAKMLAENWQRAQQIQQVKPYLEEYLINAGQFREWQKSKQQPAAPATPEQKADGPWWSSHWKAPEFNPQWERLLKRDDQGNIVAIPGAPADIVPKYLAYQQFRADQAERLMQNPFEFMTPAIEHAVAQAQEKALAQFRAEQAQQSTQQSAASFVNQNMAWIYETDATGQRRTEQKYNPETGRFDTVPVMSQYGQYFREAVEEESRYQSMRGMPQDIERQKEVALMKVRLRLLESQVQGRPSSPSAPVPQSPQVSATPPAQAPALTAREQANRQFLQQGNGTSPGARPGGTAQPAPPSVTGSNLPQVLAQRLKEAGISVPGSM